MPGKRISTAAIILGLCGPAFGQAPARPQKQLERRPADLTVQPVKPVELPAKPATAPKEAPADYVLGTDDQVSLWTPEAEELNGKVLRVAGNGTVTLPLIGAVEAAGLNASELSAEIAKRLEKYYVKPQVVVSVTEYKSQPVSVFGAVNVPGVHQVQGRKTLIEILSMAGGVRQDAGPTVIVTRQAEWGPIPVESARTDTSGQFSTAEIDLQAIASAERPQDNIAIKPNDIITVQAAHLVYVIGDVERAGGFILTRRDGLSVLQALSMAGGMKTTASAKNARIFRRDETGPKEGRPVNLSAILSGKEPDFELEPDDILFIPDSRPKKMAARAAEAALQTITGVAIWRVGNNR
jgi:polysaccharide export outer membrane protein